MCKRCDPHVRPSESQTKQHQVQNICQVVVFGANSSSVHNATRENAAKRDALSRRVGEMSKDPPRAPAIRPSPKSVVTPRDASLYFLAD